MIAIFSGTNLALTSNAYDGTHISRLARISCHSRQFLIQSHKLFLTTIKMIDPVGIVGVPLIDNGVS